MFWVPCCSFHNFFLCCPVMYLYVLSSVLLISLVFVVLSCYVSLCSEFRVAHFFSFLCAVLLCICIFWVPCCSFLYFLCVVLLCIFMFWVPCCSFHNFFVLSCYVSVCSEFRVAHFFRFCVLFCYVSLCSEFRVAHFFSFFLCCPVMYLYILRSVLLISIVLFCVVLLCIFMFWVPCCSFL